jgi:predicted PurR-regulated permease PerM
VTDPRPESVPGERPESTPDRADAPPKRAEPPRKRADAPPDRAGAAPARERRVQHGFFLLLVALTTLAFFGLIRNFLMPLFWAVVLAVVFQPVQQWWLRTTGERASLASVLTLLTVMVVVILPLVLLGIGLSREAILLYERIITGEIDLAEPVRRAEGLLPIATERLERMGIELQRLQEGLSSIAVVASGWIAQQALVIGQDAVRITVLFALMLYVLFFFLRDGARILDGAVRALPLGDERERTLFSRFADVSRATVGGALVVAAVQGAIGGLAFWALGLPVPVLWGVVMTVLSFLPAVGASLVWGPAAIILLVTGSPVRALVLTLIGVFVIGIADNVLRPILVGRYAQMPDFLILISTLGGLAVFGLSGVVIGPVIAAFFLAVWEMFAEQQAKAEPGAAR